MHSRIRGASRRDAEGGNALLMAVFLTLVMAGLSSAQFMVVHKNIRQSEFYASRGTLASYAESGLQLALHDLRFSVSGDAGKIGTASWTPVDDLGADGTAATGDVGEGDGFPTIGEPNVNPVPVGEAGDGVSIFVYSQPTAWPDVSRVVATAFDDVSSRSVEAYSLEVVGLQSVPRVGAAYVDPNVVLDLTGGAFRIDGNDHNADGTLTDPPGTSVYGIATAEDPANPGQNAADLASLILPVWQTQVTGSGGDPSIGETSEDFDINSFFASFLAGVDQTVAPGTHSNVSWGDSSNYQVTYSEGDIQLTGNGGGAGVLLVDGNLTLTGDFSWEGLVIVRGDVRQIGGGSVVQVIGSLVIGSSITVVDDPDVSVTGTADIYYSSSVLDQVDTLLQGIPAQGLTVLYWGDVY